MTADHEARVWFDQFTPQLLAAAGVEGNHQWCARHWAPCPMLGGNGIKAAFMLMRYAVYAEMDISTPVCCQAGDLVMFNIWGQCPPVEIGDQP